MLENPGAYNQQELDSLLHEKDVARISKSLDEEKYVLIPEEPLWKLYDGCVPPRVFLPNKPTWWLRYFDYL